MGNHGVEGLLGQPEFQMGYEHKLGSAHDHYLPW